jgi:hypothetical protein
MEGFAFPDHILSWPELPCEEALSDKLKTFHEGLSDQDDPSFFFHFQISSLDNPGTNRARLSGVLHGGIHSIPDRSVLAS